MPGKKRSRWDGDIEEEEVPKRNKGPHLDIENGVSPGRRPNSRASDKNKSSLPTTCRNEHDLVLVSREVRRLEKSTPWTCDNTACLHSWDADTDAYLDRQRFRCVHYSSGNTGCNYDLCGDCFNVTKDGEEPRRSSREAKPKFRHGDGEWIISPKFQTKTTPEKHSPPKSNHIENNHTENSLVNGDGPKSPPLSPRTRHTRSAQQPRSHSPPTAAGRSPRARSRGEEKETETESDFEERPTKLRDDADSPFYPSGVRFSPSVKNGSPYGRRTRSGGRGTKLTSYLQNLASEDEQSEFNRQYSRDLRKRQARKLSEEGQEERRSTRQRGGEDSQGDGYLGPRIRRVRVDLDQYEEHDIDDEHNNTTRSTRSRHSQPEQHSADRSRRRLRSMSEDERPLASRRRIKDRTKLDLDHSEEEEEEEEETTMPPRSRRGREPVHSADDTTLPSRRRRGLEPEHLKEESALALPPRRRRGRVVAEPEQSDDEDEGGFLN
jgi:hypothetical protein